MKNQLKKNKNKNKNIPIGMTCYIFPFDISEVIYLNNSKPYKGSFVTVNSGNEIPSFITTKDSLLAYKSLLTPSVWSMSINTIVGKRHSLKFVIARFPDGTVITK